MSKTDERPRSRLRHNKESTGEPTSTSMYQTFIHFSKIQTAPQQPESREFLTTVLGIYLMIRIGISKIALQISAVCH